MKSIIKFSGIATMLFLISFRGYCTVKTVKEKPAERPNIIYLFADEHRYQSMGFTEMPELKTPNMDRIAQEGVTFRKAISNNPVCVPYRSMLLSGQWCYATGMVDNNGTLAPWDKTLGHTFKAAGYTTGYTGKWHAGRYPQLAGFDWHMHWLSSDYHWESSWKDLHGTGKVYTCTTYNATKMTDQAFEFIEGGVASNTPFFLMVSWNPPHHVFEDAPDDKKALYPSPKELPWRANAEEESKKEWWEKYQGYHAHITAIDEEIGRIIKKLEELGIAENTILVYSSDHGSMMKSHGEGNKRFPHEESIRVPFLVRQPGSIPSGQTKEELFGTIDIFPTLCGLAGIEIPSFCHGQDFSPNIFGKKGPDPGSQLIMHVGRWRGGMIEINAYNPPFFRGVRSQRYTYTVNTDGPWQLFDNLEDPYQKENLINDAAYAAEREHLQKELEAWIEKAEDPYIHPDYIKMPLNQRIYEQAVIHTKKSQNLKEFASRLKLSPEQDAQLEALRYGLYAENGKPLSGEWDETEGILREKFKNILTPGQLQKFNKLEALENSLVKKSN